MHGRTISHLGRLPQEPTPALPGSEQKIRVMTERAARREQLFHPMDGLVAPAGTRSAPFIDTSTWLARLAAYRLFAYEAPEFDDDDLGDEPTVTEPRLPPTQPTSKAS
jgi:hypothetical protein